MNRVDYLKLYFGEPYQITDNITLFQPTIQGIMDYGEIDFYSMVHNFLGNTTQKKLWLWNNGIDWNKISDYELFCNLVRYYSQEETAILFGDIDFTKFDLYGLEDPAPEPEPEGKETAVQRNKRKFREFERTRTFINSEQGIEINAETYHFLVSVMREMFRNYPKTEYAPNKSTKELMIEEEQNKIKKAELEKKDSDNESILLPLISFCVNHPGFKYKKSELKEMQIYEFMDSVGRLNIYESTRALLTGTYSGFCDTSKVPKTQFDFMRTIDHQ